MRPAVMWLAAKCPTFGVLVFSFLVGMSVTKKSSREDAIASFKCNFCLSRVYCKKWIFRDVTTKQSFTDLV